MNEQRKNDKWYNHEGRRAKIEDRKLIYGVGISDAEYITERSVMINGKKKRVTCPYFSRWKNMLRRCYHKKSLAGNYHNTSVAVVWHRFSTFKAWMEEQDWEGKHLDKDILGDATLYSPDTCCFVSQKVNSFILESTRSRGDCLIGVSYVKLQGKYEAYCMTLDGKKKHLGVFTDELSAHKAWLEYKKGILEDLITLEKLPSDIAENLRKRYDNFKVRW